MTDEEKTAKVRVSDKRASQQDEEPDAAPTVDEIAGEIEGARQLAADRLDQLMRLKADYENFRKRAIREQTEIVDRASLRVVEKLLPVLDNLERALAAAQADDPLVKGVELVLRQLHEVLLEEGLERVEAQGQPFDPHEHEAVGSQTGEVAEPTVLEVVRPGYRLKGRMIRPALVNVATPVPPAAEEEGQE